MLSDPVKRQTYDKTGRWTSRVADLEEGKDWDAYFRGIAPPYRGFLDVTLQNCMEKSPLRILKCSRSNTRVTCSFYGLNPDIKGSEEERQDLLRAYQQHRGDMGRIVEEIYFATMDEEPRYRIILDAAIDAKELKAYKKFSDDAAAMKKRKRLATKEAKVGSSPERMEVLT